MPVELPWETLHKVCSLMAGGESLPHFSSDMVTKFPNLAKTCKPSLFAFAAGVKQPPRFESGGLGKLRLSASGARRVWLVNGSAFCEHALGKQSASAADIQHRLTMMTRQEIEKLARQCGNLFQWVQKAKL